MNEVSRRILHTGLGIGDEVVCLPSYGGVKPPDPTAADDPEQLVHLVGPLAVTLCDANKALKT